MASARVYPYSAGTGSHHLTHGAKAGLLRGIEEFNRGEFFQAHETWETLWLRADGEQKRFLQGVIQIAAAFHHWRQGNPQGALSLLRKAKVALEDFPRSYGGIQLGRLRRDAMRWMDILDRGGVPRALPHIQAVAPPRRRSGATASQASV